MTVDSSTSRARATVESLREEVEGALSALAFGREPDGLYGPVRYVLENGGKRLRPILLLLSAETFGVETDEAMPAALAVEVFHNFTLVHDDIMDHADERRGHPTVHVRWDESTAILCGDFMMGLSYALLGRSSTGDVPAMIGRFQEMVARLCEGQTLDKEFETRGSVSVDDYLDMVDRKTGALLQASLEIGGMLGSADEGELDCLNRIGFAVGRAFQIQDDLLDLTAEDDRWGKAIGGDLLEAKKTYILLRAIERTDGEERRWLQRIIDENGMEPHLISEARERMRRSGVLDEARDEVLRYTREALDSTLRLPDSQASEALRWLLKRMQERMH